MKNTYVLILFLIIILGGISATYTTAKIVAPPNSTVKNYKNTTSSDNSSSNINNNASDQNTGEANTPNQEFESEVSEIVAKAKVFGNNATSFKEIVDKLDENKIDKAKDTLMKIVDSMLENNSDLQEITKNLAKSQIKDEDKNFYMRQVLPNLHNMNRQLARIKDAVDKDKINYDNMKYQAERVETSVKQIVDRIESYGNK